MTIDHERCSELLAAHVRGELDLASAAAVQAHLETCADCRAEERAVRALTSAADGPELTPMERKRLHRKVLVELELDAPASPAPAASGTNWMGLVAVAASLLVGLAAFALSGRLGVGGSGADGGAESAVSGEAAEDVDSGGAEMSAAAPRLSGGLLTRARVTRAQLKALGRNLNAPRSLEDNSGSTQATADAGAESVPGYTGAGAGRRERADLRDAIARCNAAVRDQEPGAVAVTAGESFYEPLDRRVLIIVFGVRDGGRKGPFDRYIAVAWDPRNCDAPLEFLSGNL